MALTDLLADLAAVVALAGLAQAAVGWGLVRHFVGRRPDPHGHRPPVTVLKPLYGVEPLLEEALASLCAQSYGPMQIVFGLQDAADPAMAVVARLRRRFPDVDMELVVNPMPHGRNHKVANLMNMVVAARHDILVIADSDVHVAPDYLDRLVAALSAPGVGLATTIYAGLPGNRSAAAALGATAITHSFLPGVLMSRILGRQDCLGATMALRRETLDEIGGLAALADHVGDDQRLGQLVRATGRRVALARTVTTTTVPESELSALFRHELRWARTIGHVAPLQFASSTVQQPMVWATLATLLWWDESGVLLFLLCWLGRAAAARGIDRALGLAETGLAGAAPIWLLPLRDLASCVVLVSSYLGDEVVWRGRVMQAGLPLPKLPLTPPLSAMKLGTEPP